MRSTNTMRRTLLAGAVMATGGLCACGDLIDIKDRSFDPRDGGAEIDAGNGVTLGPHVDGGPGEAGREAGASADASDSGPDSGDGGIPLDPGPLAFRALDGKCLDVRPPATPGAPFQLASAACSSSATQRFTLDAKGLLSEAGGLCLAVDVGDAAAAVQILPCQDADTHRWELRGNRLVGYGGRCLESSPAPFHLAECSQAPAQRWLPAGPVTALEGVGSNCLAAVVDAKGVKRMQTAACTAGAAEQRFHMRSTGEIVGEAGDCLAIEATDAGPGGPVMTACTGDPSQSWRFSGRSIAGRISGKCLAVPGGNPLASAVVFADCDGTAGQQWVAPGLYTGGPATLLLITGDSLAWTLGGFVAHKKAIGTPTLMRTVSEITRRYPHALDAPEALKRGIEEAYVARGTRYVLLMGDASQIPVRYRASLEGTRSALTAGYAPSDLYYANLYGGHARENGFNDGVLDTWDKDGNRHFNEMATRESSADFNPDGVDGYPDLSVGRFPASSTTQVDLITTKVMAYESGTNPSPETFTFVASKDVAGADEDARFAESGLTSRAHSTYVALGYSTGDFLPAVWSKASAVAVTNAVGTSGWLSYFGGNDAAGWSNFGAEVENLTNTTSFPIVLSAAPSSAQFAPVVTGQPRDQAPPEASVSTDSQARAWLCRASGAVAYVGETEAFENDKARDLERLVFARYSAGERTLGDAFRSAQELYWRTNFRGQGGATADPRREPRVYLGVMELFGDPSMRIARRNVLGVPRKRVAGDYDGDGKADLATFTPASGTWSIRMSGRGGVQSFVYGASSSFLAPADYDGDGRVDPAVIRPSDSTWQIRGTASPEITGLAYGSPGDVPACADFDGDGYADLTLINTSQTMGWFFILSTGGGQFLGGNVGVRGDIPAPGDFDGDGTADVAVFHPATSAWQFQAADWSITEKRFGQTGDVPVTADYDGDGKTDIAVFRPSDGSWSIAPTGSAAVQPLPCGPLGGVPVPADYDGDGKADIAVFHDTTGTWSIRSSATSTCSDTKHGAAGDVAIPAR